MTIKLRSAAAARALPAVDPRLAHRPEYAGRRVAGRPDLIARPDIELEEEGGQPAKAPPAAKEEGRRISPRDLHEQTMLEEAERHEEGKQDQGD